MYRTILHIDLDYFYAQIEETKDPTLKDMPVVVCQFSGRTEDSGAVATSNYIARKYGVKSGMPIITAKKLLTKHKAAFIDADDSHHSLYESISTQIMSIVRNYGTAFENISIDEGCIDITKQSEGNLDKAREIAFAIKSDLSKEQNLTCSIGISPNKLISKMAADHQKPNGLTVIDEENVKDFLFSLELKKLHDVGPKTLDKLNSLGIKTIKQLSTFDPSILIENFGIKFGNYLHLSANGIDNEPVKEKPVNQYGRIVTLKNDTRDLTTINENLDKISYDIHELLIKNNVDFKSIRIMAITENMETHQKSKTLDFLNNSHETIKKHSHTLFQDLLLENKKNIRRIGITVYNLSPKTGQTSLADF